MTLFIKNRCKNETLLRLVLATTQTYNYHLHRCTSILGVKQKLYCFEKRKVMNMAALLQFPLVWSWFVCSLAHILSARLKCQLWAITWSPQRDHCPGMKPKSRERSTYKVPARHNALYQNHCRDGSVTKNKIYVGMHLKGWGQGPKRRTVNSKRRRFNIFMPCAKSRTLSAKIDKLYSILFQQNILFSLVSPFALFTWLLTESYRYGVFNDDTEDTVTIFSLLHILKSSWDPSSPWSLKGPNPHFREPLR